MAKLDAALAAAEPGAVRNAITRRLRIHRRIDRHGDVLTLANALFFSTDRSPIGCAAPGRAVSAGTSGGRPSEGRRNRALYALNPLRINPFPGLQPRRNPMQDKAR